MGTEDDHPSREYMSCRQDPNGSASFWRARALSFSVGGRMEGWKPQYPHPGTFPDDVVRMADFDANIGAGGKRQLPDLSVETTDTRYVWAIVPDHIRSRKEGKEGRRPTISGTKFGSESRFERPQRWLELCVLCAVTCLLH